MKSSGPTSVSMITGFTRWFPADGDETGEVPVPFSFVPQPAVATKATTARSDTNGANRRTLVFKPHPQVRS
ncbi:MAG: hypothetical protein V1748_10020 [Actinomycetota bacterium]